MKDCRPQYRGQGNIFRGQNINYLTRHFLKYLSFNSSLAAFEEPWAHPTSGCKSLGCFHTGKSASNRAVFVAVDFEDEYVKDKKTKSAAFLKQNLQQLQIYFDFPTDVKQENVK